jgi:hypothetical protein
LDSLDPLTSSGLIWSYVAGVVAEPFSPSQHVQERPSADSLETSLHSFVEKAGWSPFQEHIAQLVNHLGRKVLYELVPSVVY